MMKASTLILSLLLTMSAETLAAETTTQIQIPGTSLNMSGDYSAPPDPGGGFAIGIRKDAVPFTMEGCHGDFLSVDMSSTRARTLDRSITPQQEELIKRKLAYHTMLETSQKTGESIIISLRSNSRYLHKVGNRLVATECAVSFDPTRIP